MEPKRLFRSRKDRVIGGVCGGLGNYFNLDPVIIRVATVALFFAGFIGLLGYIIAWIIVPNEPFS
ncbi:MAG: PspC domain-containing protein [Bacteroidota bacterium]